MIIKTRVLKWVEKIEKNEIWVCSTIWNLFSNEISRAKISYQTHVTISLLTFFDWFFDVKKNSSLIWDLLID